MKQLINTYLNGTLGQIIYAGVGKASTLEWLLALDFKSLTLIEPIEITAKRRKKRYGGEKVEVIHAALSSVTGSADFTVIQPEKYSSLKQEINLRHILKNSRVKTVEPIKTIGLSDLIEQAKLSKDENNVLILNINGLERECLENTPIEAITQFSTLIIQIETQGIYTKDSHIDRQLKTLLKPLGFYFEDIKPENTIFTNLVFKRDDAALTQRTKLQDELHQLVNVNQALAAQLDQVSAERESLTASLSTSQQAQEEADKQKAELSVQVTEATAKTKQLEVQLAERTQQRDEQNKQRQEHKAQAESFKSQLDQVSVERESLTASLNTSQQALEESKAKLTQLQTEADKQKAELSAQIAEVAAKAKQLEAQLAERTQQRDEQNKHHQEHKKRAESFKSQLEQVSAERESLTASLNHQQAVADKQKAELSAQVAEVGAKAKQLEALLAERTQQRDEQNKHHQEHKKRAESFKAELAQVNAERESLTASLNTSQQALEASQSKLKHQEAEADKQKTELSERIADVTNKVKQLEGQLTERTQQCDEQALAHQKNKEWTEGLKVQLEKADIELKKLKTQYFDLDNINEKLVIEVDSLRKNLEINDSAIDKIVEKITESHKKELNIIKNNINSHIKKGSDNSVKQIESFIGIQSFLQNGSLLMEYHGWPISSDIALFLLGKIKSNNYDLIIEFGSGTSTCLFAEAIKLEIINNQSTSKKNNYKRLGEENNRNEIDISDYLQDLPQRVLTFEHNKKYLQKTLRSLQQNGLDNIVNLVHAPLVDCKINNDDYLYYSCDNALQHIAKVFEGRQAKILVLIDGPPGSTGPLARLPAVTKLLNYIGNHQLDLVLDDYNREEEKKIVELWKETIKARFIEIKEEVVPCEKGAWFCRVNP